MIFIKFMGAYRILPPIEYYPEISDNIHMKKGLKITVMVASMLFASILLITLSSLYIFLQFKKPYTYDGKGLGFPVHEQLFTPVHKSLDILPSNFSDILDNYKPDISNEDVSKLLNNGYLVLGAESIEVDSDTPFLLNTENITEYYNNSISLADKEIQRNIQKRLDAIYSQLKIYVFPIYLYSTEQERGFLRDVYRQNLEFENLTADEKGMLFRLARINSKDKQLFKLLSLQEGLRAEEGIKGKDSSTVTNPIYLEPNQKYYISLMKNIAERRTILQEAKIYNNEYEGIIDDITKIVREDSTVYSKIFDFNKGNLLLYSLPEGIVTLSSLSSIGNYDTNINNDNFGKEYDIAQSPQQKGTVRIPVLMYHQINEAPENTSEFVRKLYTSAFDFERQIAYLTKKNYKTLDSQEYLDILESGENPSQKSVLITFDDGVASHYLSAYPILKKYGQKGVFFVIANYSFISDAQLKEMSDNGMDIQSHTKSHPNLVALRNLNQLQSEIGGSKSLLETKTGKPVISIAYPGCVADQKTFSSVSSNGYSLGFSCGKSIDHRYTNRLSLSRLHAPKAVEDLQKILSGIYPY